MYNNILLFLLLYNITIKITFVWMNTYEQFGHRFTYYPLVCTIFWTPKYQLPSPLFVSLHAS